MDANRLIYQLAFSMLRGINATIAAELLQRVGSPEAFFTLDHRTLMSKIGLRSDLADDSYRQQLLALAAKESEFISASNVHTCFFTDSDYPERLRNCPDAPVLLYSLGKGKLDPVRSIAIVGTRHATAFGASFVADLVRDIKEKVGEVTIVSGLAYGIDIAAHRAAIECGLPTLAVVAHGLKMIYPADHRADAARIAKSDGAVITEYISTAGPNRGAFLARNRIVAGLSDAVIVVESDTRGGALCTARIGLEYNREVFAVPGRPCDTYSRGCNNLILVNSAQMLTNADQLIDALGWIRLQQQPRQTQLFKPVAPMHQKIIDHLRQNPDATVNDMVVQLQMPFATLSSTLFEMEMADLILTLPGGKYGVIS